LNTDVNLIKVKLFHRWSINE